MNKVKKLFNKFAISFALIGVLIAGAFFAGNQFEKENVASAAFTQLDSIENSLPNYVNIETDTTTQIGKVDNTVYLFQPDSTKNVIIGNSTINSEDSSNTNWCYYPEPTNTDVYNYFDFQTSLSLYYNLTNKDIENGIEGTNLLKNADGSSINISNFASPHDKSFTPHGGYSFTPQKLDIQFKINTSSANLSVSNKIVTLNQEGLYTLAIPVSVYSTDNGGLTFSLEETTIYYTFMIFNSNTYFDSVTGKPNITTSLNMQESVLPSSSIYSSYYFYNFAYGKDINTLPTITYNPNKFEMRIEFTDIEQESTTVVVECVNGNLVQLDAKGNVLNEKYKFVEANLNAEGNVTLSFTELGSYDLSIRYLYYSDLSGITYRLPLEKIESSDNLAYKNKSQRLYLYGYQAVYSDYSDVDTETNQPKNKELKTFDFNLNKYGYNAIEDNYNQSADITSALNNYIANKAGDGLKGTDNTDYKTHAGTQHPNKSTAYDNEILKTYITEYIKKDGVKPISTNQTPIKFLTNAKNTALSQIYSVNKENKSLTTIGDFEGFNQNTAGTYVYIIQYTFDSFMSTSGTLQSGFYHYQVFYFEVTNTTPTVTVLDSEINEIYTNGFTNKDVYILNDTENNLFDANVEITLSAKNYVNGQYFFPETSIDSLSSYGIYYQKFEKACSDTCPQPCQNNEHIKYNSKVAEKYGVKIEKTSPYANALFTIKIKSANSEKPSTRTFTIDTNPISNVAIRNASMSSSTVYKINNKILSNYATNKPFIMSWDEKASNATTYGYVKFIPFTSINYYSLDSQANLSRLITRLTGTYNTLPVSYKLDISKSSAWTEYSNSTDFNNTILSTYVKSSDGIYILEVYDQAGNSTFEIFMKDSTAPIFVQQKYERGSTSYNLISNGETISVPEEGVDIYIKWSENKAIYIENLNEYTNFESYQYAVDVKTANDKLDAALDKFFNLEKNTALKTLSNINVQPNANTGITSYNGNYLMIPISQRAYIKDTTQNTFVPYDNTTYQIDFVDDNGKEKEGTYSFLVRDASNSDNTSNEETNYKQYPSSFLSFNVTSDAAKMMLQYVEQDDGLSSNIGFATYNFNGNLYSYTDENGTKHYTHLPNNEIGEKYQEESLGYKFMYYTPLNAKKELQLSFVPVSDNGSTLQSIVLYYYPYEIASGQIGTNFYHYYTITQNPEKIKTVNIFTKSNKIYNAGETEEFPISLGNDSFPMTGRYVIERTYVENSSVANYDYFKRTISFIIDDFNLISPVESISGGSNSSLESVVGGDIVLSLYSGEGLSSIEVSFPSYNENGLNEGSFYTKESFINSDLQYFSVEGNKLPMSLYIPKNKYTIVSEPNIEGEINKKTDKKYYSVDANKDLTYYGGASIKKNDTTNFYDVYVEGVVVESFSTYDRALQYVNSNITIAEYEIKVEIIAQLKGKTLYYCSNGQDANGYLTLYLADKDFNIIDNTPVEYFFDEGNYIVTIYQADNIGVASNFFTFYKFGFKIISQKPDFKIYNGDGYEITVDKTMDTVYYTNSPELRVEWQLPKNKYQAKIDENNITIKTSLSYTPTKLNIDNSSSGARSFTITIEDFDKIPENSYISISMKYEGYNEKYYDTITKTIYFDKSAPLQNLVKLMDLTESATNKTYTTNFQQYYMRTYYDYSNKEFSKENTESFDISKMSYSYSKDNGYFKNYSYNVTNDFFNKTLKQTIADSSKYTYDTQFAYYRRIDDIKTYTQVTKTTFSAGKYYEIDDNDVSLQTDSYYEIVEMDYAGNMNVYVVYLIDSITNYTAISYTNSTHDDEVSIYDKQIIDGFNIYSNSGFKINSLNYKADPWAMINVALSGKTSIKYMKSPILDEGYIYKVITKASGIECQEVSISSLFEDVESSRDKHQMIFADRTSGKSSLVYFSIMDASINTQKIEDPNKSSAILNISIPTKSQFDSTTTSYVYPTTITIREYDETKPANERWVLKMIANQTAYGTWTPANDKFNFEAISFNNLSTGNTLQVVINLGENASRKIKYEIEDNFGNTTTVIQLANEVSYKEISGDSAVYQITESDTSNTYVSSNTIRFSFNTQLYQIKIFDKSNNDITTSMKDNLTENQTTNISVYTFRPSKTNIYDDYYKIEMRDIENPDDPNPKILHIRLFYNLPYLTFTPNEVYNGGIIFNDKNQSPIDEQDINQFSSLTVNFQGKSYTSSGYSVASFDSITVRFADGQSNAYVGNHGYDIGYTYSVYLSKDNGSTWENINNEHSAINGYTFSEVGDYLILIKYDAEDVFVNVCEIFTVTIIDESLYPIYSIRVDNMNVEKSDIKYTSTKTGIQYEVNYIVGIDYNDKDNRLTILENEDKGVDVTDKPIVETTNTNVYVEIYHYTSEIGISGDFTIIYIYVENANNIVSTFTYDTSVGTTETLKGTTSAMIVANKETESNFSKLKLNFTSYYGIAENKINVEVLKLFNDSYVKIDSEIYRNDEFSYIYLERAGSYRIKLYDSSTPANVQTFNNKDYIDLIFLNSVPFIISHTDENGNVIKTEPIQKAIYNSNVTIELPNLYNNSYYQTSALPQIFVKLNGKDYTGFKTENRNYIFTTPGFYTVKFSAISKTGIQIREEEYNFSIITKNEIKFAYEFAEYSGYYIENVEKDGVDITNDLINLGNYPTVNINNKTYLSGLSLANDLKDEKTGDGRYKITINPNSKAYSNVIGDKFTFEIRIGHIKTIPINITAKEGESTSKNITISFNIQNLYNTAGDCYVVIGATKHYYTSETLNSYEKEVETFMITTSGTYYIQVYTVSGRLLYSYKVIKTDPLNAFAIIAIIIGVLAVGAIIGITIAIRKRQKAK